MMSLVIPVLARSRNQIAFPLAVLGVSASTIAAVWALATVVDSGTLHYNLGGWAPPLGIEYVIDHVSAFVALVVTSVATLVIISTRRWVNREASNRQGPYYGLVMLLLAGLVGMLVTGDLFNLFVFLEVSSLAAYALVFMGGRRGMIAGFRYLIIGSIGGSFYLLGVGFLYFTTGTLNMADMQELLTIDSTARSVEAGAVFIFAGLGLKMALVPMHLWLPDAYTFSPSSVNSLIAPIMTKVAAYSMIRMFLSVFPDGYLTDILPVADGLLWLGLIGIVLGSIVAGSQMDVRRMLAYSSISQLGLIAVGIGLATPLGFAAALLHVMNHAVMKATLFLSVGSVRFSTGATTVDGLIGLGKKMPLTMIAFTLSAISMVGIPPAAGFFSKWYAVQASVQSGQWVVVVVILGSTLLTAVYMFRVLERVYLRPAQPESIPHVDLHVDGDDSHDNTDSPIAPAVLQVEEAKESPLDMVLPALILGVSAVVLGVVNSFIVTYVLETGL
jgi:multicomponent Na+:H+ antiporter subunit D